MSNANKYIGIFDSGVGGLTVVKSLLRAMPNENIIYLADNKHMPYGDKTNEEIINYVLNNVEFLSKYDLKAILIACNTADGIASSSVKAKYDIPVYGVIEQAAIKACAITKNNKVGVIATTATINSNEYPKQIKNINPQIEVYTMACPFLAQLIEEGNFDIGNQKIRTILKDYLTPLINNNIDTLILGCTHYDLLSPIILDIYPNLNIVSSSKCVIDKIAKELQLNNDPNSNKEYYVTSNAKKFEEVASMFMDNIKVKEI